MSFEIRVYTRIMTYLHDRLRTVENLFDYAYSGTIYATERLTNYIKNNYLSGHPLKVVTGRLRKSIKPVVRVHGKSILGGVSWGGLHIPYSFVHINREVGMETWIYPVRRKFLTIPVGVNENRAIFKSPLNMPYSILKFPFIGMYSGRNFEPYFLLKNKVLLKSKVGVDEIMREYRTTFMKDVMSVVKERMKRKGRK